MNIPYTEILFALYIVGGQASMDWLVSFLGGSKKTASAEVRQDIDMLASAKLLDFSIEEQGQRIALTGEGNRLALMEADILSGRMVAQWREARAA